MKKTCETTAFPRLTPEQLACVAKLGELREFTNGDYLFEAGERDLPLYVIKTGTVDIFESSSGTARLVTTHVEGEFTGDVDLLTGRPIIVSAISRGNTEVYRVPSEQLRRLLSEIPDLSDMLLNAFQTRREMLEQSGFIGIRVVGSASSKETSRIREFFYKNHVPHTFFDIAEGVGREQLRALNARVEDTPLITCGNKTVFRPTLESVAECLGISRVVENLQYDLIIVGAGPAGLAAAVYASSEALRVLVIDRMGPGGQASSSSKIENFIGFPSGISGAELANRGYLQALKFGTHFTAPVHVTSLETDESGEHRLTFCTGQTVSTRCVLVASGVSYRQLELDGGSRLEGAGLYYAATSVEANVCRDSIAVVVGGGNSAGQAAMFLAENAKKVILVIRGDNLGASMSAYLCNRILHHSKIQLITESEVTKVKGESKVEGITLKNKKTGLEENIECSGLFIFIGATPHTDWLPSSVSLDSKGFVKTGSQLEDDKLWSLERPPCDLETSLPGVMAAGDVRAGSTKRCGFAVGDGSLAVACVHRYLGGLQ